MRSLGGSGEAAETGVGSGEGTVGRAAAAAGARPAGGTFKEGGGGSGASPTAASIALGGYLARTGEPARPTKCPAIGVFGTRLARPDGARAELCFRVAILRAGFRRAMFDPAHPGGCY